MLETLVEEELGVEALAHEAPVVVGEPDDHRVDLARLHARFEIGARQQSSYRAHAARGPRAA